MPEKLKVGRLWLIAGTGEGPELAKHFLNRGWRLRVSVVTPSACTPYASHPRLELMVGPIAGAEGLRSALQEAERQGDRFDWVIDASHPFASQISSAAAEATQNRPERLLRLQRPPLSAPQAIPLRQMGELSSHRIGGERLLLAIGSRHLKEASLHSAGALLHSRVLPHPQAIRQALQAGLPPKRIACFRPTADGAVEKALCRHWQIDTILCRQSGGVSEALWLRMASELDLRLLLLQRPAEPEGTKQLPFTELIEHVGNPGKARDDGSHSWSERRIACLGADDGSQPGEGGKPR
ncbi:MAG: precorrin-6A/cobalt-precorrin-6A reductase [Cyanobium sp.]